MDPELGITLLKLQFYRPRAQFKGWPGTPYILIFWVTNIIKDAPGKVEPVSP